MNTHRILTKPFGAMTWRRTAYALLALPLSTVWFSLVVTGISTGASLLVTLAGVPVLWLTLWLCAQAARLERAWTRAAMGIDIPSPSRKPPASDRWYAPIASRLTDPLSWREATGLALSFVTGTIAFTVTVVAWATAGVLLTVPLWGPLTGLELWNGQSLGGWDWAAAFGAGVAAAFTAPWLVRLVTEMHAGLLRAFLRPGPPHRGRTARLSERRTGEVPAPR